MFYRRRKKPLALLMALLGMIAYHGFAENAIHVVAKGETVFSISRAYKVSQEDLMRHNNLADASKLQVGMKLIIPIEITSPSTPILTSIAYSEYTVSKNDTLYSIARSKGVTLQALRDINGFSKNYVLKAGEKIKIPASSGAPSIAGGSKPPAQKQPAAKPPRATPKPVDPSVRWPVTATEILYMTSNSGVLVSGRESESVKSLTGGVVVHASPWRGYANVAIVETNENYRYVYGVCETLSVKKGDIIEPGAELGKLGIYPASGKPELVLIVLHNGSPVDPAKAPRF